MILTRMSIQLKFFLVLIVSFWLNQWFVGSGYHLYALTTLPGTFLHELAHYTMAAATDGHPSNFNLIPQGDTLGSVSFHPNWYNAAAVSWAPFLLMPLTALLAAIAARAGAIGAGVWTYVAACSWAAGTPSSQDFSIALSVPSSWPLGAAILLVSTLMVYKLTRYMVFK